MQDYHLATRIRSNTNIPVKILPFGLLSSLKATNFLHSSKQPKNKTKKTAFYSGFLLGFKNTGKFRTILGVFVFFQWKPDRTLDAVVASLTAGPDEVDGLDLGDAEWASEDKYAKDFSTILRKYKKSVTNVCVTMRALVERPETEKSNKKTKWRYAKHNTVAEYSRVNVLDLIGTMPKLTSMQLTFGR